MQRVPGSFFASRLILASCVSLMSLSVATTTYAQDKKKPAGAKPAGKGKGKADEKADEEKRNAAREAYNKGTTAYEIGDYAAAVESFKKAYEILPSPHAQFWIAQALDNAGKSDEAIAAYEKLLADPDVPKIGQDKQDKAKARLEALKNPPPAKPAEPPAETTPPAETAPPAAEPPPEPEAPPPATDTTPPPEQTPKNDLKPTKNLIELGLFTGPLFISSEHNLVEDPNPFSEYSSPAWLVGLRLAYFPASFLGIEGEYAHGFGSVEGSAPASIAGADDSAAFNTARGHLVLQVPSWRFVPFAVVGAGVLQASSDRLGSDGDFLLEAGIGGKFAISKVFSPRLDVRFDMHQKKGGSFSDGITVSPEVLLGASFTFGR